MTYARKNTGARDIICINKQFQGLKYGVMDWGLYRWEYMTNEQADWHFWDQSTQGGIPAQSTLGRHLGFTCTLCDYVAMVWNSVSPLFHALNRCAGHPPIRGVMAQFIVTSHAVLGTPCMLRNLLREILSTLAILCAGNTTIYSVLISWSWDIRLYNEPYSFSCFHD